MSSERYIQDGLIEEWDLPPKQEKIGCYGYACYQDPDDPYIKEDPDLYIRERVDFKIYPTRIRYMDDNFAIANIGGGLTVLTREEIKKMWGPFMGEKRFISSSMEWIDDDEQKIAFNPGCLRGLKIIRGKNLEKFKREEIGGKTLGMNELKPYEYFGYKIPEFIVVPTSFYDVLQLHGFEGRAEEIMKGFSSPEDIARESAISFEYMAGIVPEKIKKMFKSLGVYENLFRPFILPEIIKLCEASVDEDDKNRSIELIVRSSSPLEDGENDLFQGVFSSFKVSTYFDESEKYLENEESLYEAFQNVMLSPWTTYAEFYLRNRNLVGKVSRSIAEIIQVVPRNIKFIGRAYINDKEVEVEYLDHDVESGNYVGNRIYLQGENVVRRINNIRDYPLRGNRDNGKLMPNKKAVEISRIMGKLSAAFPKYNQKFNVEFGVTKDGTIYLFQIRPTRRGVISGETPDLSQIDREKVLVECSEYNNPFSVGKVVGPVINLLKYKYGFNSKPNEKMLKELTELDKEYPGAIIFIPLTIPGLENIHMLTPHKKGIVICFGHNTMARNDHCVEGIYKDPTFHIVNVLSKPFKKFENGMRLGIVSTGGKAVFYRPDPNEPDTIIYEPPTILEHQGDAFKSEKYIQLILPDE